MNDLELRARLVQVLRRAGLPAAGDHARLMLRILDERERARMWRNLVQRDTRRRVFVFWNICACLLAVLILFATFFLI